MTLEIITLTDPRTGATARILPGFGMNCYQFQATKGSKPIELIWAEQGFAAGRRRASGSGIPLLFPFPGRIAGTKLEWDGQTYPLPEGDGQGNAIHGFVIDRPWRVLEQQPSRVVGQFQASIDDAKLLDCWPADFRITATYEVTGSTLRAEYLMDNPDERPLPCGFGTHPYFALPLGGPSAESCKVRIPVTSTWQLVDMNATGRKLTLHCADEFARGMSFKDMHFDNVFGDLVFEDDRCRTSIEDPDSGNAMTMTFDRSFREIVVYTPPHREAICVEPYTCVPDPVRLAADDIDAGLRVLQPGESFLARVDIGLP